MLGAGDADILHPARPLFIERADGVIPEDVSFVEISKKPFLNIGRQMQIHEIGGHIAYVLPI